MMLAAVTAFGLASCEDVPAPFVEPELPGTGEFAGAEGNGTLEEPFNVVAVIEYVQELGADVESPEKVYIKGIVCSTSEISPQFGNATFDISADGTLGSEKFTIYRAKGLNNQNIKSEDEVQVGDEVIVYGNVVNYRGNTPETIQGKAYIYWQKRGDTVLDGSASDTPDTPTDGAKGDGSLENPFNAAAAYNYTAALPAGQATSEKFYVKGIVCQSSKMDISVQYKNATFHISEDGSANGTQFLIFRTKGLNGADITSEDDVQVGDEVVVYASLVNYMGNTPETAQGGIIYSQKRNGQDLGEGGGETPDDGEDTPDTPTEGNILENGDFELWDGNVPTNWKSASTAGNVSITQSTEAHGGTYAASMGYAASSNKRMAYKETTLPAGTYKFTFYAKGTDTTEGSKCQTRPGYVAMKADGSADSQNYKYGDYATLSATEWTLVEHEFTLTEETTLCLVIMSPKGTSYHTSQNILVDDASLVKVN